MARVLATEDPGFYQIQELWSFPWAQWLDGQVWELTYGTDFQGPSVPSFRDRVKYVANRQYHLAVRTRIKGDKLYIQAYKP
jgi:hypothetical protein